MSLFTNLYDRFLKKDVFTAFQIYFPQCSQSRRIGRKISMLLNIYFFEILNISIYHCSSNPIFFVGRICSMIYLFNNRNSDTLNIGYKYKHQAASERCQHDLVLSPSVMSVQFAKCTPRCAQRGAKLT